MSRLTAVAEGATDLVVTRRFAAPRERVWRAMTDTDLMREWMTSDFGRLTALEGEAAVGATHRFVWVHEGGEMTMVVTYELLDPPHRIVHRESWPTEGYMDSTVETRLAEVGTETEMVMTIRFPTAEARDKALASGMAEGMEAIYRNLDAVV